MRGNASDGRGRLRAAGPPEQEAMDEFDTRVARAAGAALHGETLRILQVHLGFCCNQSCRHCHLEASPERTEAMDRPTMT